MLLENGANMNAQGGTYGNALYVAFSEGHEAIVKLGKYECAKRLSDIYHLVNASRSFPGSPRYSWVHLSKV